MRKEKLPLWIRVVGSKVDKRNRSTASRVIWNIYPSIMYSRGHVRSKHSIIAQTNVAWFVFNRWDQACKVLWQDILQWQLELLGTSHSGRQWVTVTVTEFYDLGRREDVSIGEINKLSYLPETIALPYGYISVPRISHRKIVWNGRLYPAIHYPTRVTTCMYVPANQAVTAIMYSCH